MAFSGRRDCRALPLLLRLFVLRLELQQIGLRSLQRRLGLIEGCLVGSGVDPRQDTCPSSTTEP